MSGLKSMLLENGVPERDIDHWHHMAELGVLLPAHSLHITSLLSPARMSS